MLEILPKVWGIVLAAIVVVTAFALWYTFQTTVGREVATLNLRVLADAVPYGGKWHMAIFNLGPAANITGVWTDKGFEPLGKVLGMGQNTTLQLVDRPLKVQACAVGHASACELVDVAGWAVHTSEPKNIGRVEIRAKVYGIPIMNTTLTISTTCASIYLYIYGAGIWDSIGNGITKTYVIPTAFPLFVYAYYIAGGEALATWLLPGKSYRFNIVGVCSTPSTTTSTNSTTPPPPPSRCLPSVSVSLNYWKLTRSHSYITAYAQLHCAEQDGTWSWIIYGSKTLGFVTADACTYAKINETSLYLCGGTSLPVPCQVEYFGPGPAWLVKTCG